MEKILLFIKHHLEFIWNFIEWINEGLVHILYAKKIDLKLNELLPLASADSFVSRKLVLSDAPLLYHLIHAQNPSDLKYFKPHKFDLISIRKQLKKKSFLMMGTFDEDKLIGYFFLRFFFNKKCFVGRLTDANYRGKGVGKIMNELMYGIAWGINFRCLSTVSKNNHFVMQAHQHNNAVKILKELSNGFILIEFIKVN